MSGLVRRCVTMVMMALAGAVLARHRGTGGLPAPRPSLIVKTTFIFNNLQRNKSPLHHVTFVLFGMVIAPVPSAHMGESVANTRNTSNSFFSTT